MSHRINYLDYAMDYALVRGGFDGIFFIAKMMLLLGHAD